MLDGLFKPRSIAIIGASSNPYSIGNICIRNLLDHGFQGPIFPINPKSSHIMSLKAYRSVLDVPDGIDLVNISVNYKLIPQVIEECGKKGVKFAIVHTAGFKEVGQEGLRREQEMVALAHRYGMRIFGPNSQGVQNSDPAISLYANFTFVPMKPGNVSIIAQGGGMGELLKLHLHKAGLGHRLYCSYGNECDLSMPEILEYYGRDEGTRVIMMQVESFKEPARFLEAASRITPHKPILAIKAGRTREGTVAVSSHTGTLVDQAAMARAMFRKAGVVAFEDSAEMVKTAVALSTQPPPAGRRIGIITNTGGPGVLAVDQAVESGLELAVWSEAGRERLRTNLYAEASLGNPVDVVATAGPEHFYTAVDTLLKEDGVDMVLVYFVTAPFVDLPGIATRIKDAASGCGKPIVSVVCTIDKWGALIEQLRTSGIPVFEFPEDAARSLARMSEYSQLRDRVREAPAVPHVDRAGAEAIVLRNKGAWLPMADALALLESYGIPVPRYASISSERDLDAAAAKVGFPCVLKADAASLLHKSSQGGVALHLADASELSEAFGRMRALAPAFLLMQQKPAGCELIVGAKAAAGLGSLVMFGLGGVLVEVMHDVAVSVAPLSSSEARELTGQVRARELLRGLDQDAVVDLLVRVSRLAADFPQIAELDVNPVIAYATGACVVDVRIRVG
jgi:acetate---CoA ligase (ADP-forming)